MCAYLKCEMIKEKIDTAFTQFIYISRVAHTCFKLISPVSAHKYDMPRNMSHN